MQKYRKKTRELLIKLVFQMSSSPSPSSSSRGDFSEDAKDAFLADTSLYMGDVENDTPPGCIFDEAAGEKPDLPYLDWAFFCLRDNLSEVDSVISAASEKWAIDRMATVDLAILRVAVAELLYLDGIDSATSISEAVLMAKKYGSERSAPFVNGILGTIARSAGNEAAS